jgi:hypothetical protein
MNYIKYFITAAFLLFSINVFAHHMAPDEMSDFITDQLVSVDSPHLLSTEDDPSLAALYTDVSSLEDVDYVAVLVTDDIAAALDEIEEILLMLEDGNNVLDFEVLIEFDMNTGLYTLTLFVDFEDV